MGTACYAGHLAVVPSAPTSWGTLSWFPNFSYLQCQPVSSLHAFTQASPSPGMHSPSPFLLQTPTIGLKLSLYITFSKKLSCLPSQPGSSFIV